MYRLFETLEEMRFPLYDERPPLAREKRWHLDEGYASRLPNISLPHVRLSLKELVLLQQLCRRLASERSEQEKTSVQPAHRNAARRPRRFPRRSRRR